MKFQRLLTVALSTVFVTACGGGGSGTPDTPDTPAMSVINSANQSLTTQEAVSTAFLPLFSTQTLIGAQSTDESALFKVARTQLNKLPIYLVNAKSNNNLTGVVQSQTVGCTYGGSFTVSVSDTDNSNMLSAGDSITVVGNNCSEQEGLITGSLTMTINSLTGSYGNAPYSADMTMSFNGFSVATSQSSASLNGSISLSQIVSGVYAFSETISVPSLALSATYAGETRSRSLTGYSATMSRSPNTTYIYLDSYAAQGTVISTALFGQSFTFNTPIPFVRKPADNYPSSGVMVIAGGGNSQLRVTGLSSSQISLELDANGDGTFESTSIANWNSVL